RDALWSRRGANGNGVVALEFPAFTCGLPSAPTAVTTSPVDPSATSVPTGANPTTRGFPTSGTAFLVTDSTSDNFTYTGTDATGFMGVTGISLSWATGATVRGTS